jgi:hypothetical protein
MKTKRIVKVIKTMNEISTNYKPSFSYLIFLKEAIKGGYKPNEYEQKILKQYAKRKPKRHMKNYQTIKSKQTSVASK